PGPPPAAAHPPPGHPADTQCFSYDSLQRLTEAWTPGSGGCASAPSSSSLGGAAPYWSSYRYDVTGNRLSQTRHSTTGSADTTDTSSYPAPGAPHPHAVQAVTHTGATTGTDTFATDSDGNATARPGQTLTWDGEGRPSGISAGGQPQTNIYDADGNLLIQTAPGGSTAYLDATELHVAPASTAVTGARTYTALGAACAVRTTKAGVAGSTV